MRLIDWRPLQKGQLLGFSSVELPIGLCIYEVPLLHGQSEGLGGVADSEGRVLRELDGRPAYARVMGWRTKRLEEAFSSRVITLVRVAHPQDV
jgi:hypothetical protein